MRKALGIGADFVDGTSMAGMKKKSEQKEFNLELGSTKPEEKEIKVEPEEPSKSRKRKK